MTNIFDLYNEVVRGHSTCCSLVRRLITCESHQKYLGGAGMIHFISKDKIIWKISEGKPKIICN
jgi:hypothetical protein